MLVLSRKPQETIVFPNLGITLEIVRVAGGRVRVGIDAPQDIAVFRGELMNEFKAKIPQVARTPDLGHGLRNLLHTTGLGLMLMEKQLSTGRIEDAEETLAKTLDTIRRIDAELETSRESKRPDWGRRALLVEDDSNEAELLAGILRLSGYVVETASDGIEALESLQRERPHYVLLDMNLPRCDGPTTLAAIRANPTCKDLRVYAVSGSSQRDIEVRAGSIGVNRWFQKPLDPERLLQVMDEEKLELSSA